MDNWIPVTREDQECVQNREMSVLKVYRREIPKQASEADVKQKGQVNVKQCIL